MVKKKVAIKNPRIHLRLLLYSSALALAVAAEEPDADPGSNGGGPGVAPEEEVAPEYPEKPEDPEELVVFSAAMFISENKFKLG